MESSYERCLAYELTSANISYQIQVPVPLNYKGIELDCGYWADLIVEEKLLLALKSVETILPIHEAQLLTYLRLAKMRVGLLINFNVKFLRDGLRRFVL